MIVLRVLLVFWKPIAWVLTALGLYTKGRGDERKKAKAEAAEQALQQHKDREDVESDIRLANARDELRANWRR